MLTIPTSSTIHKCKVKSLSRVQLFATPWTVAYQAPLSRLQQYMNRELPDVQAGFRKGRDQIGNTCWIMEKAREFQTNIYFGFIDYAKAFDCVWIATNCGKFLKRWEYQTTWPAFWEICMQFRKQQLELDMEQQIGKEYVKTVYCHPAYLTYMQSTSGEGNGTPLQYSCLKNPVAEEPGRLQSMGSLRGGHDWATSLALFTFMALEKEMATHSSVLA